jgi:hypothetical protein
MAESERSRVKEFFLADEKLSLKLLFDNVRNYGIVAGIFYAAMWLQGPSASGPPFLTNGHVDGSKVAYILNVGGVLLGVFNGYQTWLILGRVFRLGPRPPGVPAHDRTGWPWFLHLIEYLLALCAMAVVVLTYMTVLYFVAFVIWVPIGSKAAG